MNSLIEVIEQLIAKKAEGGFWDYKRCWYENNKFINNLILQQDYKCTKFFPQIFNKWKDEFMIN